MTTRNVLIVLSFAALAASCREHDQHQHKPFFDTKGRHIGDSVFINGLVSKIVFLDESYIIDSIVFYRQANSHQLRYIMTFKKGKNVFENIEYYENGHIKKYDFINEGNENYFYERIYNTKGEVEKINGYLFFQGYVTDINPETLEIKKGTSIHYKVFYPNPPDCYAGVYVKYKNDTLLDVFKKSSFLGFLQLTSNDTHELGTYEVDILLELKDKKNDSVVRYNHPLFFKVVP